MQETRVRSLVQEDPTSFGAKAQAPQLLSLCPRAEGLQLLSPQDAPTGPVLQNLRTTGEAPREPTHRSEEQHQLAATREKPVLQ